MVIFEPLAKFILNGEWFIKKDLLTYCFYLSCLIPNSQSLPQLEPRCQLLRSSQFEAKVFARKNGFREPNSLFGVLQVPHSIFNFFKVNGYDPIEV